MAVPIRLIDAHETAPEAMDFGWGNSPVGRALVAWDALGIRYLTLQPKQGFDPVRELALIWPLSTVSESRVRAAALLEAVFQQTAPVSVVLQGTDFQRKVWRELTNIASGQVQTYSTLAAKIDTPGAARAVGRALAANRVAYLIPCHRIIKKSGEMGQFRWGSAVKADLLRWECRNQVAIR